MKIISVLKDSFLLLLKKPKLFLPKIFIAFLYSIVILSLPKIAIGSFQEPSIGLLNSVIFAFLFVLFVSFADTCINAVFPFFVEDYFKRKDVSFLRAIALFRKRAFVAVASPLIAEIAAISLIVLLSFPVSFSIIYGNYVLAFFFMVLELAAIFSLAIIFFLVYPVASLGKSNVPASLEKSISLAWKNLGNIAKLAAFSFAISIITFIIPFAMEFSIGTFEKGLFLLVFILLRLFVAVFATYQYIINPVYYVKYLGEKKVPA